MSTTHPIPNPPSLATWLLEHATPRNDALAGDLLEEFRLGRSARWYWRQILAAIAFAFSRVLLNRGAALLFTTAWCTLVPAWLLAVSGLEARFNLHQRFGQMDWPWSFVCDLGLLFAANLAFIWTGIALYLVPRLWTEHMLSLGSLVRGLRGATPLLCALSAALVILPKIFLLESGVHSAQPQFGAANFPPVHIAAIIVRLPFFVVVIAALWKAAARPHNRHPGVSG